MEPEYDKRGNIPGPGPGSLKNFEIPRWQSEEDEAVLNKENYWIDELKKGTLDVGKQILDSFVYGGAVGLPAMRTPTKIPKLPASSHKTINITPKGVNAKQGSKILNEAFNWKRFHSNSITQRESLLKAGVGRNDPTVFIPPNEVAEMGLNQPLQSTIRQGPNEPDDVYTTRYWDTKFDELGIPEGVRFSLREMLDSDHLSKAQRRNIKSGISNPNYTFKDYKEMRTVLVDDFLDGLEDFGIDPSTIEIHHISSLRHVSQLFEGLERSQWPQMLNEIYNAGLATGNDPDNLMAMQAKAHRSGANSNVESIHGYLDNELGKYNEQITGDFGDDIRDLSVQERVEYIRRYAEIRQSSIEVGNNAIREVLDQAALDQTGQKGDNPFDDMTYGEVAAYDAGADIEKTLMLSPEQIKYVQSKISKHIELMVTQPNYEAFKDSITSTDDNESAATALRNRGLTTSGPTQDQLFDLGKKPPKNNPDDDPPIGSGWDITDPNE